MIPKSLIHSRAGEKVTANHVTLRPGAYAVTLRRKEAMIWLINHDVSRKLYLISYPFTLFPTHHLPLVTDQRN